MPKEKSVKKSLKEESSKKKVKVDEKSPKKKNEKTVAKQNSKSKKDKRPDKYAGVEKGDLPNKATAFAKLFFNVKSCRALRYFERTL